LQELVKINNESVEILKYKGKRVITLAMIDKLHNRPDGTAHRNMTKSRKHFVKNEDYFEIARHVKRPNLMKSFGFSKYAPKGFLITESGYLMLVKTFRDNLAWKVQKELVRVYFRAKKAGLLSKTKEDIDRIKTREQLKKEHRLYLTDTIKNLLESLGKYNLKDKKTRYYFSDVHDEINLIITGETAREMRRRTGLSATELLRDYFPIDKLTYYSAITISAANAIKEGNDPIKAVHLAAKRALPSYFKAEPIQLVEPIKELEREVFAQLVKQNAGQLMQN
jgi:hypothetical protein